MKINKHYLDVKDSYLFAETGRKIAEYKSAHPDANVIKLSIGDVTRPLCPAVIEALSQAVEDMGRKETFHGYGPDAQAYGYEFLKSGIKDYYSRRGVILADAEIFISDGAKSDLGNILDLFERSNAALIPDPVYPAYVDVNIMDGRLRGIPAPEKMMSAFSAMAVLTMSAKLDMATMTLTPMIPLVFSRALRSSSRRPQMLAVL